MQCSLSTVNALVALAIGLLLAAIAAALGAIVAPYPADVGLLVLAAALVVAAGLVLKQILDAIVAYRACRDRTEGASSCSPSSALSTVTQASFFISPTTFLIAAGLIVLPWFGKALAAPFIYSGVAGAAATIALLLGLLTNVHAYASCRDLTSVPPPGRDDSGLTGTPTGPLTSTAGGG